MSYGWEKVDPYRPAPPTRRLTAAERFAQADFQPVDWGDRTPPADRPHATHWAWIETNDGRVIRAWKLSDGTHRWDVGVTSPADSWTRP